MQETYGQKVARLRRERGWTQAQLAEHSGVKRRTIQDIELDKRERPQRATILRLNSALEIDGDAPTERQTWDEDVRVILDIIGAYLMTQTPEQRIRWLSEVPPVGRR